MLVPSADGISNLQAHANDRKVRPPNPRQQIPIPEDLVKTPVTGPLYPEPESEEESEEEEEETHMKAIEGMLVCSLFPTAQS